MFESLTTKLQTVFSKLKQHGRLNEKQIDDALREVRIALLEADVNFKVVKDFIAHLKVKATGAEVLRSLTPAQQVIKIVSEELTSLMGVSVSKLTFSSKPPTVIMLVGLQGSGKTTACAKLGYLVRKAGKHPLLVAADTERPAATKQLTTLGAELSIDVFSLPNQTSSLKVAEEGLKEALGKGLDVLIIDTSGRLHIDEEMMDELKSVKDRIKPHEVLLVVDAMTGQDAVNIALAFKEKVDFDGVIMTKLDGDARGGAALSIGAVTERPIKFISTGEKTTALEPFYPDRMSQRILGMGDMLTLIEKAEEAIDKEQAEELAAKLQDQSFTFEDFLNQLRQVKKMGPLSEVLKMMPGLPKGTGLKQLQVDDKKLNRIEAIIQSMTVDERLQPAIISGSRRQRIAKGSGTTTQEVNQLLKQFAQTKKLLKQAANGKLLSAGGRGFKPGKKDFPFM